MSSSKATRRRVSVERNIYRRPDGCFSHLDHDWRSPVWRHWLAALGERRTMVRYDERGCGLPVAIAQANDTADRRLEIKPDWRLRRQGRR